jgi:pimeloyl-ACP methyl ester carboxylesterase
MLRDRVEDKLPVITAPTLVVRGGKDPIVSQAWAEDVARRLPKGRLVVLPTAGHAVNYNAPADLAALVREFVVAQSPLAGTDDAA